MVLAHQVRECRCIVRCVDSPHSYDRGPDQHPPGRAYSAICTRPAAYKCASPYSGPYTHAVLKLH